MLCRCLLLIVLCLGVLPVHAQDAERLTNVILLVPDGAGPAAFTLARRVLDRPLVLDAHLGGSVATASAANEVTDSAASATAYACGVRAVNRTIGVDAEGRPCRTLLEAAEARGMATGLVTTAYLTDATPGAFAAHSQSRYDSSPIAEQILAQGIEVILGGGASAFLPTPEGKREDGRDLLAEAQATGYTVVTTPEDLAEAPAPLLGLFAASTMDYEMDRDPARQPSLSAMLQKALSVLRTDPDGFFLLVETEGTDEGGHNNDPAALAREIESFDAVFEEALEFAEADGQTLVVSVADHETGGLTLARAGTYHWWPEALRDQTRSIRWMERQVAEGDDRFAVLQTIAGIDSLSVAEQAQLETATLEDLGDAFSAVISARAGVAWSTGGHTAIDVGLYRYGPGSDRLSGHMTNAAFGRALFEIMGFDWTEPGAADDG